MNNNGLAHYGRLENFVGVPNPGIPNPLPNAHNVNDRDLTEEDISKCFARNPAGNIALNMGHFNENVLPVLKHERKFLKKLNHKIDCRAYDTVYVTSDLHADYRKFIQTLSDAGLITLPKKINPETQNEENINLFSDDIYMMDIITKTTWNNNKTLLIVLGDIVDGKRGQDKQVDDRLGLFEILIHMFMFNLRRKALLKQSLLAFTIGNHDYHALYDIENDNGVYFYNNYVHDTARNIFQTSSNRREILLPFYEVHPLFFISLFNPDNNREELVGIHAGFHQEEDKKYIMPEMEAIQVKINAVVTEGTITTALDVSDKHNLFHQYHAKDAHGRELFMRSRNGSQVPLMKEDGGLWSRHYDVLDACAVIEAQAPVMFVVGHCPTIYDENKLHSVTKKANPAYEGCMGAGRGHGCVVLSCNNKLAHVDVGMSTSFYPRGDWALFNRTAEKEMLKLTHSSELSTATRYYNIVERVRKSKTTEMFREPLAAAGNGAAGNGAAGNGAAAAIGGAKKRRRVSKRRKSSRRIKRTYRRRR
jgi:hypothetical protein